MNEKHKIYGISLKVIIVQFSVVYLVRGLVIFLLAYLSLKGPEFLERLPNECLESVALNVGEPVRDC